MTASWQGLRAQRRGGFTLIEVAISLSLVVGLVVTLFAFYNHAIDMRRAIVEEAELAAAERAVMDGLTDELRAAMAYPFLNLGLEGSNDRIVFIRAVLPGPAAWAVRSSMEDPIPPEQDLEVLTYRLRLDANVDPPEVLGLERLSQKTVAAQTRNLGQTVRLVSRQLRFLCFRFTSDGSNWQDYWRMEDPFGESSQPTGLLPMAVEITLGMEPRPPEMAVEDYLKEYPTFRRVVFVPAGARPLSGTVVRGAGGSGP
jgi:type II secretory pathway component PulJ